MIALDTNVLVRLLVADDPAQAARAADLLEETLLDGGSCLITDPVLCELEWVLDSCYRVPRTKILEMLQELLATERFVFEDRPTLRDAVDGYASGRSDFSDYLIGAKAAHLGARATFTFPRALKDAAGFEVLGS